MFVPDIHSWIETYQAELNYRFLDVMFGGLMNLLTKLCYSFTILNLRKKTRLHFSYCYVRVTVHRNKFICNKTNWMHQFHKFILSWNSTCFEQFVFPSSGVYSLYTQQWCMSYRFVNSFQAGPGWNCSSIHPSIPLRH